MEDRLSIGEAIDFLKPHFATTHVMKVDDDCVFQSQSFFKRLNALISVAPNMVFSPFPVGLLKKKGGPELAKGRQRSLVYVGACDVYFCLRPVLHIGGFARVPPKWIYERILFNKGTHSEDKEFSFFAKIMRLRCFIWKIL